MSKSKRKQIDPSQLHKYAKLKVGYSSGNEISPYEIACKGLKMDGRPMPTGTTYKKWVSLNAEFIAAEILKQAVTSSRPSKAARSAKSHLTAAKRRSGLTLDKSPDPIQTGARRQPTEQSVQSFIKNYSNVNPASDDFLSTFEWKAVRMMAIKKYRPICQCCGASAKTGAVIHVDHIKPRKIFPNLALELSNLQILCSDCNAGKGNWDMTNWRDDCERAQAEPLPSTRVNGIGTCSTTSTGTCSSRC